MLKRANGKLETLGRGDRQTDRQKKGFT